MLGRALFCLAVVLIGPFARGDNPPSYQEGPLTSADRSHWAFRKPERPLIPQVKSRQWVRNPIDAFVLEKLEANRLSPSPPLDKLSLLRRITFGLTGLPPTPEEELGFLEDASPDAYERIVERLLASPQYGERWAQHWLDVVRYADSNGYEADGERPHAWRYRDYVIRSFNADKPFDRFVREQIAGDELAVGADVRASADLWIATGVHRCGPVHLVGGNTDPEVNRQEVLTEMVQGVGAAFLGLTMNCARCHDHKFDPISQGDYYRLEAFFAASEGRDVDFSTSEERATHQRQLLEVMARIAPVKNQVAALDAPYQKRLRDTKLAKLEAPYRDALATNVKKRTPEQQKLAKDAETLLKITWDEILAALTPEDRDRRAELRARQHALEAELPMPPSQAWAIVSNKKVPTTYVLKRGDVKRKLMAVEPAFPRVLGEISGTRSAVGSTQRDLTAALGGGVLPAAYCLLSTPRLSRLDLAAGLTDPDHPLTARVFVNRVWQHHFGRGIVGTPNDFGLRGERPTHPELLDWLATEFVRSGWSVKHLQRLIVLSSTYRQASHVIPSEQARKVDPDNKLLWRMNRLRLESESLRDEILAAAGTLNRELGGPMVRTPLEPEVYDLIFTEGEPDGLWPVTPDDRQHMRRSIYLFAKRNVRLPLMEAFDQPDRLTPCAARAVSTFAPQALILMNGPFARQQARVLAARLLADSGADLDRAMEEAYRRALGRSPRANEKQLARAFLADQTESVRERLLARLMVSVPDGLPTGVDPAVAVALADYCLALFNSNEFLYIP
jgi:Protein of unknown function (DUF1553)/Protein of unknown function (DUF1549)